MKSPIVNSFLKTANYFTSEDLAKVRALQSKCDDYHRQMRRLEPALEEKHLDNLKDDYMEAPTPEAFAAITAKEESLQHLKATGGVHLGVVASAYEAFLRAEVLPWLLAVVNRIQGGLNAHLDGIEDEEKARSTKLIGNESCAAGYLAHCAEVRRRLDSLPERFGYQFGGRNPYTSLRSGIKELASLGFDLCLLEACGELEPMVQNRADRAAKRIAEEFKAYHAKLEVDHAAAVAKEETDRKAAEDANGAAAKTDAAKSGMICVSKASQVTQEALQ